ncbi:unnamed protein product [Schistosoma curassoni]|uniref:Uncharacterized protein n=1 Tax=Schistosoma curassoni TaxID=6186 RepID=A0A183K8C0_9TREM|nr:unnamed protein product [Schistosoma curassoni]
MEPMCTIGLESGFSNSLGGITVSIGPVKVPDIRLSSSHFRKQHPWCEKAVRLPWQRLYTCGHVRAFQEGERTLPTLGRTRAFGSYC